VNVRDAVEDDVEAIASIHVSGWQTSYRGKLPASLLDGLNLEERTTLWSQWIGETGVDTFVATEGPRVLGFARLCPAPAMFATAVDAAEITHLYIDPGQQGHGAGRMLLEHALQMAQERGYGSAILWVLADNRRARSFYESFGFEPDGAERTEGEPTSGGAVEMRYWVPLDPGAA
jgi:ribosomal protein S18 acetylase RimI-like enzyme